MENLLRPTRPSPFASAPAPAEDSAAPEFAPGRINGDGPIAIVDIGSNSVRLVVYEHLGRSATPLFNEKELCGLARGLATRGRLDPARREPARR